MYRGVLNVLSTYALGLHERCHELGYRAFQRLALAELAKIIPFDAAVVATGTLRDGVPQRQDDLLCGLPQAFIESWELVRTQDRIIIQAMQSPGRTFNHDVTAGPIYAGLPQMLAHSQRWGIMQVLCTAQVQLDSQLYWVMALSRANPDWPFSEQQRETVELLSSHLVATMRRARIGELQASCRSVETPTYATALLNRQALILEAEPRLATLLRRVWSRWTGPLLPRELWELVARGRRTRLLRGRIVLQFDAVDDGILLHVREAVAADALSVREREVAAAFALGETARQVACQLGIAPNTVRRHLANVYEKLGISSKTELDRMIRDL